MTLLNMANPAELEGRTALDDNGSPVGIIEGIYLDNESGRPKWAAVRVNHNGALVPLEGAVPVPDGVRVMFTRELIAESPCRQPDLITELSQDTEELLYRYYGEARRSAASDPVPDATAPLEVARNEAADLAARASDVTDVVKEKAGGVIELARRQTTDVVEEAQTQAREVLHGARSQVSAHADVQVQQIARGLHQLAEQARALADGDRVAAGPLADLVGRAGQGLAATAADVQARGPANLLADYSRAAKRRPAPVAIGTTIALIAGSRLLKTPTGSRAKDAVAPRLKEGLTAAGRSVADELKPLAQQRVAVVKEAAVGAADRLSGQARGVAHDVSTQSKRSAKTIKGTTKASARRMKSAVAS